MIIFIQDITQRKDIVWLNRQRYLYVFVIATVAFLCSSSWIFTMHTCTLNIITISTLLHIYIQNISPSSPSSVILMPIMFCIAYLNLYPTCSLLCRRHLESSNEWSISFVMPLLQQFKRAGDHFPVFQIQFITLPIILSFISLS